MSIESTHLQVRCARTARTLSLPLERVETVQPTQARADVVMVGGERVPVQETPDKVRAQLAQKQS